MIQRRNKLTWTYKYNLYKINRKWLYANNRFLSKKQFSSYKQKNIIWFFGNFEILYEKENIIFIVTCDKGQISLELRKKEGKEKIYISLLYNSDILFNEEKIIDLLKNRYNEIIEKMKSVNDEMIILLKRESLNRRLNLSKEV